MAHIYNQLVVGLSPAYGVILGWIIITSFTERVMETADATSSSNYLYPGYWPYCESL